MVVRLAHLNIVGLFLSLLLTTACQRTSLGSDTEGTSATAPTAEFQAPLPPTSLTSLNLPPLQCSKSKQCPKAIGQLVTLRFRGVDTCTATLVKPDVILTASHCVPWENLNPEKKFTGNCWFRFPQTSPEALSDAPTAIACGQLISASQLGSDVGNRIYPDHAFIRLAQAAGQRRPMNVHEDSTGELVDSSTGLLFGVITSSTEHHLELLRCRRDDSFPVPKVSITRGEALIFPSCGVLHGFSGGPILDPKSLKIIGVFSGVIGFDSTQPNRALPSIGTFVAPLR